jgi:hypothetical protein
MTKFNRYEVLRVDSPVRLVSKKRQPFRYEGLGDRSLAPGYYLVLWPLRASDSTAYGPDLRHLGPVASHAEAQWLKTSALALGIVEPQAHIANPGRIPPKVHHAELRTA